MWSDILSIYTYFRIYLCMYNIIAKMYIYENTSKMYILHLKYISIYGVLHEASIHAWQNANVNIHLRCTCKRLALNSGNTAPPPSPSPRQHLVLHNHHHLHYYISLPIKFIHLLSADTPTSDKSLSVRQQTRSYLACTSETARRYDLQVRNIHASFK